MNPTACIAIAAVLIVVCITVISIVIYSDFRYYIEFKKEKLEVEEERQRLQREALQLQQQELLIKEQHDSKVASLKYSTDMIEFMRTVIATTAVLKFKDFCDHHPQMDKITESNVKSLANDVAISVNKFINASNIVFSDTLFTRDFYNHYVIETSITYVKDLVTKKLEEII